MNKQLKHLLEFFKDDPWPMRVGVLAMCLIFLLELGALRWGSSDRLPWLVSLLTAVL
jgi:hypothetical protein